MKYFLALALVAAVASAQSLIKPKALHELNDSQMAIVMDIMGAINRPTINPTIAAKLRELLYKILGFTPPAHLPAIVDFPVPEDAIASSPVAPSSPLVQIIVNVKQQQSFPEIERPVPEEVEIEPTPVEVVEDIDQVQVVDEAELDPEPVIVAPIIVAPAVVEPETLN